MFKNNSHAGTILFQKAQIINVLTLIVTCLIVCSLNLSANNRSQTEQFSDRTEISEQQEIPVSGTVTDAYGEPLPGAGIMIKGTTQGTITDNNGTYSITAPDANAVLVVSYVGFITQEITVANRRTINVTLSEDTRVIDEVVVVGYGVQKKVNLSGAVQSISSKSLASRPVTNVNLALQGLGANVNISNLTGRANYAADINIRGFTSINGGSALILLDNVPVSPSELSRINPEDIESVSILKDAASSAIYGGRASFGVVLVTTKQARDKLTVDVNANIAMRSLAFIPEYVTDVYETMVLQNPASTRTPLYTEEEMEYGRLRSLYPDQYPAALVNKRQGLYTLSQWAYWDETDYIKTFLRQVSPAYTANIRIANRTEKMNYAVSGGYYRQEGMMRYGNDIYDRFNLRATGSYDVTPWWKVGSNMSFNYSNYDMSEVGNDKYFWYIPRQPLRSLYNPDGTYTVAGSYLIDLPQNGGRSVAKTNETQLSLNTTIDLIKDIWNIKADANFKFTNGLTKATHIPVYYRSGPDMPLSPITTDMNNNALRNDVWASTASSLTNYQVYNIYTDFHKTFADKHFVQVMAGFNQESLRYTYSMIRKSTLISTSVPTINLATGMTVAEESINTLALRGAFGRLNYIYDNKYIVELNSRYDGTSRFPKESRFGFFPSGSLAWVLSNENFFRPAAETLKIDQLKFRGSYGVLGNQAVSGYYPYIPTMGSGIISVPLNNELPLAIYQPGVVAGNLTWERVRSVNFGGDLALFNNRISLGVDIYTRYTEGMLVPGKALPNVFGVDPPSENAGDLKTKGWEITLGLNNKWQVGGSPLHVGLNLMIADNRSYITKFDNPSKILGSYYEGQEIGELWGLVTDGFLTKDDLILRPDGTPTGNAKIDQYDVSEEDNRNTGVSYEGDLKFKDLNNDGRITLGNGTVDDPGDRIIIGNTRSRYPYSFELNADWKGFDLRAFFQGVGKRDWYVPGNNHSFWGVYGNPWAAPITANRDHWTPENPNARWPRLKPYIAENTELAFPQTRYLQNASYLRLKNLTIGYSLPTAWTSKLHVANLRLYFSGENMLTFHHIEVKGIDPELLTQNYDGTSGDGGTYPMQRVFSFGFNLTF